MKNLIKLIISGLVIKKIHERYFKKEKILKRRIFISHSWSKSSSDYKSLIEKLEREDVPIYNHSIPIDNAFEENRKRELEKIFRNQMLYCSKIFILAIKGLKKDTFVMTEIKIAKKLKKEIIAIKPNGQKGIPNFIKKNADIVISNNINSIIKVLRK